MKYETPEIKIEEFELAEDIAALSGTGDCHCAPVLEEDEPFYEKIGGMFDDIFK